MSPVGSSTELEIRLRSLWVVGGLSGNGCSTVVPQIDAFDPVTKTWYPAVASFRSGYERSFAGVVGYQGKIYVIGGFDSSGTPTQTVQIYDIETDTWLDGTNMTAVRANISAVVQNGIIYVMNGTSGNHNGTWSGQNTTYRYNIAGDNWSNGTAPGTGRANLTAYRFGGTIYSLGGRASNTYTPQTYHDGYICTGDAISNPQETVLLAAKVGFVADVYTTSAGIPYLIIAGGVTAMTGVSGNYVFYGTSITAYSPTGAVQYLVYPFVTTSTSWITAAQSLPGNVGYGAGLIHDSVFYHMGGTSSGTTASPPVGSSALYCSDLSSFPSNTWLSGPSMPVGRYGHGVVKILSN